MRLKTTIENLTKLQEKLANLAADTTDPLKRAIVYGVMDVHRDATNSIMRGAKSGREYEKYNPRRTHRASAPGQPPAADTGRLASSVRWNISGDGLEAEVGTDVKYGAYLEHGTRNIEARPWLFPAAEKNRHKHVKRVAAAVKKGARRNAKR